MRSITQRRSITSRLGVRVAPHDFQEERVIGGRRRVGLPGVGAAVGEHALQSGKALANLAQQQGALVAVLHDDGMHHQADRQAQRVDQGVDLAALHPLARLIAHGVGRERQRKRNFQATALMSGIAG